MSDCSEIKHYYDDYGERYDDERSSPYYRALTAQELSILAPEAKGKKTLEIGCGTGLILAEVAKQSKESWGIDLSSGMLAQARSKGLNVKESNATSIDFPNGSFDVVYSFKVLPHIPDIRQVLEEISRLLVPEGRIVLEFYNPYSIKHINNVLAGAPSKVYIRYDSYKDIVDLMSGLFRIDRTYGLRVITPFAGMINDGMRGRFFQSIEQALSSSFLKRLAGYTVVVGSKC